MRAHLFRWHKHKQLDVEWRGGWLSLGFKWRNGWRPIAYWSSDATPTHSVARGWR
jgi:hypothetical protein